MTDKRTATVLADGEGDWLAWLGHPIRYLATGERTGGKYAMNWSTVPIGAGPPRHQHDFEEGFYVVKGEITFTAGNQTVVLTASSFINIGGGTAHTLRNTGGEVAEIIVIVAPAGFDEFQFECGAPIDGPDGVGAQTSRTTLEQLKQAGPKYGINLAPAARAFEVEPNITVRRPGEGKHIAAVGDLYRFLAVSDDTQNSYALWEATVFPGGGPPPHVHSREEEGFFLLDGELTFVVGDKRTVAGPGAFANLPVGVEHSFKNESDVPARMLILVAAAGLEKMFERTGQVLSGPDASVSPPSSDEIKRLLSIAPEYGIEIRVPAH
jgi:mannose-6-phosphate isomerase-like protein (cupin superfamily)